MSTVPDLRPVLTPWAVTVEPAPNDAHAGEARFSGRTVPTPWPAAYGGDLSVGALAAATRTVGSASLKAISNVDKVTESDNVRSRMQ